MTSKRRTPKRGRYLPAIPTEELFAADPEFARWDQQLRRSGFVAQPKVRLYRCLDGTYSVRVVWRRREDDGSVVLETRIRETARYSAVEVTA